MINLSLTIKIIINNYKKFYLLCFSKFQTLKYEMVNKRTLFYYNLLPLFSDIFYWIYTYFQRNLIQLVFNYLKINTTNELIHKCQK